MHLLWTVLLATIITVGLRIVAVMPRQKRSPSRQRGRRLPCKTLCVLGSGGHTAEMLQLIKALDPERYTPRCFVIAASDRLSASKVGPGAQIFFIPRVRHVGQGWATVPWSAAKASIAAIGILWKTMPDLILCNGPGSCVPICVAAYVPKLIGFHPIQIVYVESFARVNSLSLTGKLLYPFVDRFIVQWPELQQRYSKAEYCGILV
ncbi:oligosaccharide biosynthesis protein Alg14 like-domain-containing protein [Dichotomocladium elegans]|nr:oligosaccharide biosynthesis protein Alg14 like-domain-containing protein [Dichotomocladium elegans]